MVPRKNKEKHAKKKPERLLRLAAVVLFVSFGSGFLIGLGRHRDGKQVAEFVRDNIKLEYSNNSYFLTFQCGENQRLIAYDLLYDETILDRGAIEARRNNPLNKFSQNELFGAAAGFATASLGVAYSFNDEVKLITAGETSLRRVALVFGLAIPTAYVGYSLSDYFKLECNSDKLYEYLYKAENWKPYQFSALKNLFETVEPCIPRRISFGNYYPERKHEENFNLWFDLVSGFKDTEGIKPIEGLTKKEESDLTSKISIGVRSRLGEAQIDMTSILWGDSIFMRLYGAGGFTQLDPKIDGEDFRALIKQANVCRRRALEIQERFHEKMSQKLKTS